ncbi:hypothetical protein PWG15_27810 (plasmid) [Ensifer adhaerens]|nr:hypothetical protein [Ensifer adhaerens]WDZ79287.1 hypothetical protein PWG15_27810 [Ensifer adhaerens]
MISVSRSADNTLSTYKIGKDNNKRLFEVLSNSDAGILSLVVAPDPDNR